MLILKETKDVCFVYETVMCSIMVATLLKFVCFQVIKLEAWFKLIVHLVVSKYDSGFAFGVHTHLQIGV